MKSMKRTTALLLGLMLCLGFASCEKQQGSLSTDSSATVSAQESMSSGESSSKPIATPSPKPTPEPTPEPETNEEQSLGDNIEQIEEDPSLDEETESCDMYVEGTRVLTVQLPSSWKNKYTTYSGDRSVAFYSTANQETGGKLFTIQLFEHDSGWEQMPNRRLLRTVSMNQTIYDIVTYGPSDVQGDHSDESKWSEYEAMYNDWDGIIDNVTYYLDAYEESITEIHEGDYLTISGTFTVQTQTYGTGSTATLCVVQLDEPITARVYDSSSSENVKTMTLTEMQVNFNSSQGIDRLSGTTGRVSGTVMYAHSAHHLTPVLLTDAQIVG